MDDKYKTLDAIQSRINQAISNFQKVLADPGICSKIADAAQVVHNSIASGGKLLICGNGGSAADAQHIAGEFICKFYKNRTPLPAVAITTDTSVITSISNDYSYNDIFARQVRALGKKGDVLLGISTSGSSRNVLEAFKIARELNMATVLLTGSEEKEIALFCDVLIKTPSNDTPRIQEIHLLIEHILCEMVEKSFYGDE